MVENPFLLILRTGRDSWNKWREQHPGEPPNLAHTDLQEADLADFDLSGAILTSVNLWGANLRGANLATAIIAKTDFSGSLLMNANLSSSNILGTNFTGADLTGADLREANIAKASFDGAEMSWVNLSRSYLSKSSFARVNFTGADMRESNIAKCDFTQANLIGAYLDQANHDKNIFRATILGPAAGSQVNISNSIIDKISIIPGNSLSGLKLRGHDFSGANLRGVRIAKADLTDCNLSCADLSASDLRGTFFQHANLSAANLEDANLSGARFDEANLDDANLSGANLCRASFRRASLCNTNLTHASLVATDLSDALILGCHVFGASAWDAKLDGARQENLIISDRGRPVITVDNLDVAQFIYLLLSNRKIRTAIETITSKLVLILGRFTPERKIVLDTLRKELALRNYLPVVFDFDAPSSRDITETVSTLAHLSRFVVADITDAKSIPQELMLIVPTLPSVPVQPILLSSQEEYGMFEYFRRFPWVLKTYRYATTETLLSELYELVIRPCERKVVELAKPTP